MGKVREDLPEDGFLKRVVVKTGNRIEVINANNIVSFSSDGDYVRINSEGKVYLKLGTMAYYEKMLGNKQN